MLKNIPIVFVVVVVVLEIISQVTVYCHNEPLVLTPGGWYPKSCVCISMIIHFFENEQQVLSKPSLNIFNFHFQFFIEV
jgi:hypothetical protein